jgi:hypothetical protein
VLAGLGLAAGSTALLTGRRCVGSGFGGEADLDQVAARRVAGRRDGGSRRLLRPAQQPSAAAPRAVSAPAAPASRPAARDVRSPPTAAMLTEELARSITRALRSRTATRAARSTSWTLRPPLPRRPLQLEAEVLRIDALAKIGRKDAARQHAEAFLRRHPNSVLATRVRAHVAD